MEDELSLEMFNKNPSEYLEQVIKIYTAGSENNRLKSFDNANIFDEPLVGFASGDDTIFQEYKNIIGDFHLSPREILEMHVKEKGTGVDITTDYVSVISWILPISYNTRLSHRKETLVPSLRWNHTRWYGQEFNDELARFVVSFLEQLGYQAVAPDLTKYFRVHNTQNGMASSWSQRHIAYAAGLGTFSLNDGFITPKGIAMRCNSVVCNIDIPASPRTYENHLANCLYYRNSSCRRCIERCPAGAISEQGHDKNKCRDFLSTKQKELAIEMGIDGYIGRYVGCGLCQVRVPCEDRIPPSVTD